MLEIQTVARYAVIAVFAVSLVAALASWLVRTQRVSPFGALGRTLRAASEPLIRPVERQPRTRGMVAGGGRRGHGRGRAVAPELAGGLAVRRRSGVRGWTAHRAGVSHRRSLQRRLHRARGAGGGELVRPVPLHLVATAGLCPHGLGGRV